MAFTRRLGAGEKYPRLILVAVSTGVIVVLLAAYAFLATPELSMPNEVTVTGTVTVPGATPSKIVFINRGCGERTEAAIFATGTYSATLDNQYSYNVTITYKTHDGATAEKAAGTLVLESHSATLSKDWVIQP